jgi:hypothetical protein
MYDTTSIMRMHPIDTFARNDSYLRWNGDMLTIKEDINMGMYMKYKMLTYVALYSIK